jgi:hypothetical protein
MSFFQNILNSIYAPQFYKSLPKKSLGSAFGYYFLLSLLLTIITVVAAIFPITNGVKEFTDKMIPELVNKYPVNLQISIKNGKVSTNVDEPYFIKLPSQKGEAPQNLLVIDTKDPFRDDVFEKYNTVAVLTKDHFYYKDTSKGEIRGNDLKNVEDFTLNKTVITNFLKHISPYFIFITPFILLFMFLGLYLAYTVGLIHVAIVALLLFLLLKVVKPSLSYKESFKATLFGITLGLILEALFSITGSLIHFHGFPFMTTIVTLAIIILNYKKRD